MAARSSSNSIRRGERAVRAKCIAMHPAAAQILALLERRGSACGALILLGFAGAACQPCNRDGCDALRTRAPERGMGRIAGVVASESDVVNNDCQECAFAADVSTRAWPVAEPVASDDELRAVTAATAGPPLLTTTTSATGQYSLVLPSQSFVVCFQSSCFNATAAPNLTATLNVRLVNGVSHGFLWEVGSSDWAEQDALFLPPG